MLGKQSQCQQLTLQSQAFYIDYNLMILMKRVTI
jgi:hypothetical protein